MSDDGQLPGESSSDADAALQPERGAWRSVRVAAGVGMIAIGVVGCVLPIIPGVPFLVGGVALLGTRHPLVRPFTERLERWRQQRRS
jgi:hypothetical protein